MGGGGGRGGWLIGQLPDTIHTILLKEYKAKFHAISNIGHFYKAIIYHLSMILGIHYLTIVLIRKRGHFALPFEFGLTDSSY